MSKLTLSALTLLVSTAWGAAAAQELPLQCDPSGELGPSDQLRPGQSVWVGEVDNEGAQQHGRIPFCTDGDWVERHGYEDDNIPFCVAGEEGLFIGHESSDSRNTAEPDPETGLRPDTKIPAICRNADGVCVPCADYTS